MADMMGTIAGFWPKFEPTPAQGEAIGRTFRGLSDEQIKAVCEQVYRTQKAARREPDVRLLDEQAGRARRDESVKRHEARAEANPGGATEWQIETWSRMRRCGWDATFRTDYRGFFLWLFREQYLAAYAVYVEGAFRLPPAVFAAWWWRMKGQEVLSNLTQAVGDDPRAIEDALARIVGDEYPDVARWREEAPARKREHQAASRRAELARKGVASVV
ncbi:MAG: hypothetical protein QG602_2124 [Verrucomicrobiota bacterium]|nr:hypothetical protein [Verrucomicrobiota bacterium]